MAYADPQWRDNAVSYGLGTGEGLMERLAPAKAKAEGEGEAPCERRLFALESEFGGLIAKARRDGATLTPTLCQAWDDERLEVNNRGNAKLKAEGHVSIWANITNAELHDRLSKGVESVNGFGNRFLWIKQARQRRLAFGGDLRCLQRLAGPVRDALAAARCVGEVQWSDEAKPIWAAAYEGLCQAEEQGHWSLGRARPQALRLTLLYALLDGSSLIRPEHVHAGLSAWAWCQASAGSIFGFGLAQAQPEAPPSPPAPAQGVSLSSLTWGGSEAQVEAQAQPQAQGLRTMKS